MPDGDRFYRKTSGMGKGWRKAFGLACNNSDPGFPIHMVLEAIFNNLRGNPNDLERARRLVLRAFEQERQQKLGLSFSAGGTYLKLDRALNLSGFQGDFYQGKILENSVKKMFLTNKNSCLSLTEEQINERFGQTLAIEIFDSRVSRVRDIIMDKQNRSFPEQLKWEKEIRRRIAEHTKRFLKEFVNGQKIRKPATRRIDKNATSKILNRSLNVL